MTKYHSNIHRHTFFVIAFLTILFAGLFFLPKSAEMQSEKVSPDKVSPDKVSPDKVSPEQVFSPLKKLSYSRSVSNFTGSQNFIETTNADATGRQVLTDFPDAAYIESTWSPDGSKVAYVISISGGDIYVVNANGTNRLPLANDMSAAEKNPSWSVAGVIAYERDNEIWTMNGDGTNQALFSGISQVSPKDPKWSPDGSKLAFTSGDEIWTINADGTNEQQITNNSTDDTEPDWSPDGLKLVYQKGSTGIAVINVDGTNEVNLTNSTDDRAPAWSDDNTKIAFVRRSTQAEGLYLMNIDGSNQYRLFADTPGTRPIRHFDPAWRPIELLPNTYTISGQITRQSLALKNVVVDLSGTANAVVTVDAIGNYQFSNLPVGGNYMLSPSLANNSFTPTSRTFNNLSSDKIADFTAIQTCAALPCVTNGRIAYTGIKTVLPDGSNTSSLSGGTEPNYSWDGTKIVFSTGAEIYKMNSDGSSVVRLTNNSVSDNFPAFSPDGQSIVFHSNRDGNTGIFKINADGTNEVRLTNEPGEDLFPSYSPDGSKIIFVRANNSPRNLYTMNPNGGNQTAMSTPAGFYSPPSYSFDGTKLIFTHGGDVTMQSTHTANADGSNFQSIASGLNRATFSPDGTKIVSLGFFFGIPTLFTANVDGTNRVNLAPQGEGELPVWQPILTPRRTNFDFDGDQRADISVFRPSENVWYLLNSQGGSSAIQFGLADDNLVPADYDGDLKTDVAVWRSSEGNFYINNSSNGTVRVENFGLNGDIPTVGDWDGDGKADLSVYRSGGQSIFYHRASSNNPMENITSTPWGITGDKPVIGDFDGDGKQDAAVFRPSNRVWYILQSQGGFHAVQFGLADDKLVPADYDGDLKTDIAVYRDGVWYILRSSDGGVSILQFGISTDVPVPADYDGDGKADIAVYRDGIWYILQTTNSNASILQFGLAADKPMPASYIQ